MSEEASAADPQGKNFRSSYYDSLVFRGEEKNIGCLETLLKADSIGKKTLFSVKYLSVVTLFLYQSCLLCVLLPQFMCFRC